MEPLLAILADDGNGHDLPVERAVLRRARCLPVTFQREAVQRLAAEAIFFGHHLGAGKLAEFGDAVAAEDAPGPGTGADAGLGGEDEGGDRKSTRLNSSH